MDNQKRAVIYSRVSTQDQKTLTLQTQKCAEYAKARGWEVISEIQEVGPGATHRPQRAELIKKCRRRECDAVIVWKLDRWGRSVSDIISSLQELQELGVQFISITEALDFSTPIGRAMSALLAVFAEFERDMISERVKAGLAQAKKKGKRLGRPPKAKNKEEEVKLLWEQHQNKSLIAKKLGISRRSVGRYLN